MGYMNGLGLSLNLNFGGGDDKKGGSKLKPKQALALRQKRLDIKAAKQSANQQIRATQAQTQKIATAAAVSAQETESEGKATFLKALPWVLGGAAIFAVWWFSRRRKRS